MPTIVLFHSILGLRPAEQAAADRLRAAGHTVLLPDLFEGRTTESVEEGFAIEAAIGWDELGARARAAVEGVPPEAVLAGASMGAAVLEHVWPLRPAAAGLLLLHGTAWVPDRPTPGQPVQAHIAEPDPYVAEPDIAAWTASAAKAGLAAEVFRYPGVGHYFTDAAIADHDPAAAALLWERALGFLARL
jgi:dienelactone hydrolase